MKKLISSALTYRLSTLVILFSLCICGNFWSEAVSDKTLALDWVENKTISLPNSADDLNFSIPKKNQPYGIATPLLAQVYQIFEESAIALASE
ncbi:MAG: hypothetical protein AAF927_05745 [Bacteroidota bacterium]